MKAAPSTRLPFAPLLRQYLERGILNSKELAALPVLGRRFGTILSARQELLHPAFLEAADHKTFERQLIEFYSACADGPLHLALVRQRAPLIRRAFEHLVNGKDPLARKIERCLVPGGVYHVEGLGLSFWSAVFQALDPEGQAGCLRTAQAGLVRLGLGKCRQGGNPWAIYAALTRGYTRLRQAAPALTSLHLDHFLSLVAGMPGRDFPKEAPEQPSSLAAEVRTSLATVRARQSLRLRLKKRGRELQQAREGLEAGLAGQDSVRLRAALRVVDPISIERAKIDWERFAEELTLWIGRLWEADDGYEALDRFAKADPIPGAGPWLPASVLHLKDPARFLPGDEKTRHASAILDDALTGIDSTLTRYRLANDALAWFHEQHGIHSLEAVDVLAELADRAEAITHEERKDRFLGFCSETFRFLEELSANNHTDWMEVHRSRYRFAVREPLVELCRALARRYVEPVLNGIHRFSFVTAAQTGGALTSVHKNDFGRGQPYHEVLWITFYHGQSTREMPGRRSTHRRNTAQFFVRLDMAGLTYGLRFGNNARDVIASLRRFLDTRADQAYQSLTANGAVGEYRFGHGSLSAPTERITDGAGLRRWAAGKEPMVGKHLPKDSPLLRSDELVGEILATYDRLLPLALGVFFPDRVVPAAGKPTEESFTKSDFCRLTYLDDRWLTRASELLRLKKQLILQGVPGTGKTHVARCLAKVLTGGQAEAVRMVQFHPAYSYEEFVEGLKVRKTELNGKQEIDYPIEPGLLCAFAALAARRPSVSHVLLIDEINRGNLPRIFGELLYLLEYRDQAVVLPCSRREFRLPANLYLLGTMNAADRSVAQIDHALRRRFSFLDMPPDAGVLRGWLQQHPPSGMSAEVVISLFERLNSQLRQDLGAHACVGHSYFMATDLDEARLRMIWEHHVGPLLADHFAGRPERLAAYELQRLLPRRRRSGVSTAV